MKLYEISPSFAQAIVAVQGQIEGAKKASENTFFKKPNGKNSKYADLASCWDACRDALQANGVGVLQFPSDAPAGHVGLTSCLVFGKTGEVLSEAYHLPIKDPTSAQAGGSAITYLRRYALCSIIGICPEDDDGNAASKAPASKAVAAPAPSGGPSAEQLWASFTAATDRSGRKEAFLTAKASSLSEPEKTSLLNRMAEAIKKTETVTVKDAK